MPQSTDTDIREIRDLILGLDKKIDALDKKVEVNATRTDERFNTINQRFDALETDISDIKTELRDVRGEVRGQDARLWGFVVALFISLMGVLAKVVFFTQA